MAFTSKWWFPSASTLQFSWVGIVCLCISQSHWSSWNSVWKLCHWMPIQCHALQFPIISNNDIVGIQAWEMGAIIVPLKLGYTIRPLLMPLCILSTLGETEVGSIEESGCYTSMCAFRQGSHIMNYYWSSDHFQMLQKFEHF